MIEKQSEEKKQELTFISHIFNVMDMEDIPSRIVINSLAFMVGGFMLNKEQPDSYNSIEEAVADCSLQIVSSIERDFKILEVYSEP